MILNKLGLRIKLILSIVSLILLQYNASYAGTIVIKPGQFDHFTLQIPDKILAGENFVMKVYVYDANNNLITNFSEYGKEFKVEVSGSSTVQPSVLGGASFSGGVANILISNKKAENITFSIRESGGTVPVISKDLAVLPNKLDHFVLQSKTAVNAGTIFDVRVIAKDMFDNTVSDLEIGRDIKITSTGTSSIKMVGGSTIDFKNGAGTASFVSEKTGDVAIELQEVLTGSTGKTQSIAINPALLSNFTIQAPKSITAGEPFDLLIAAYDPYGNIVKNYAAVGSGIKLSTTGSSKIEPSFITPSEFRNGQAVIKAVYEKAEDIQVLAKENNRDQEGRTDNIMVMNASPDHFVVITPDTALSGQKFKIKIEAYDRFNNIVSNFNLTGNDLGLITSGTGIITPARISPSDFINGVAVLNVLYDKAESFLISAKMFGEKTSGSITMKEQEIAREISKIEKKVKSQKTVDREVVPLKKVTGEKKKKAPKEAIHEVKTANTQQKTETQKEVTKAEKPLSMAKKESQEPLQVKKMPIEPQTKKQPAQELKTPPAAETPLKDIGKDELYQVSKVSIIEAKDKAMLVINILKPNGHLDYVDEIESKYGKEWLKLSLKPAVNKTEKSFKFSSAFIGEVRIEENQTAPNSLSLYIELLPSGVTYDVARVKNTLIVTIANP